MQCAADNDPRETLLLVARRHSASWDNSTTPFRSASSRYPDPKQLLVRKEHVKGDAPEVGASKNAVSRLIATLENHPTEPSVSHFLLRDLYGRPRCSRSTRQAVVRLIPKPVPKVPEESAFCPARARLRPPRQSATQPCAHERPSCARRGPLSDSGTSDASLLS